MPTQALLEIPRINVISEKNAGPFEKGWDRVSEELINGYWTIISTIINFPINESNLATHPKSILGEDVMDKISKNVPDNEQGQVLSSMLSEDLIKESYTTVNFPSCLALSATTMFVTIGKLIDNHSRENLTLAARSGLDVLAIVEGVGLGAGVGGVVGKFVREQILPVKFAQRREDAMALLHSEGLDR